jgi:hypothetical protein
MNHSRRFSGISTAAAFAALLVASGMAFGQPGPPADENHFRCYIISQQTPQAAVAITLDDQFTEAPMSTQVGEPVMFCPPTAKSIGGELVGPIENEEQHYTLYNAPGTAEPRDILVSTQFSGDAPWQITTPKYVMVPTAKTIGGVTFDAVEDSQHYWCYEASGPRVGVRASLLDQFSGPDTVRVTTPTLFCAPAEKVHGEQDPFEILDEELHYACYEIHGKQKTEQHTLTAENQFERDEWQTAAWEIICAPASKAFPEE